MGLILWFVALQALLIQLVVAQRIVAMGDLHGDLLRTLAIMRFSNIIDHEGHWAGGDTIFVQTGDIVDRGDDTIKLYELIQRLQAEAPAQGGRVVSLLGNHEIMNLSGDWRYVSTGDINSFGGKENRVKAFSPEGWIGGDLIEKNLTAKVGSSIFVHGGIHPSFAQDGIEGINLKTRQTLLDYIGSRGRHDPYGVFGGLGPTWYRGYALDDGICPVLEEALALLEADRMVMGHTVQRDGFIHTRCGGKAVLIDIGISHVYGGHYGALEIVGDELTAIYKDGKRKPLGTRPKMIHQEL
ncbi:Metallo-dependent phosphatase-like protein [Zychaea mexicana]|uniref:Metallo-dependent phosphatase-like protein n=1 Tax=Zychaea mexicana TaxID=64656 RepID=UPI0022FE75F8|nr:Metallo-dependent phosphatase-like protein [Zychaea mexicana]KAI9492370.1 Metallo-dependent phosphatase-like protein [Zychaea mexicana]